MEEARKFLRYVIPGLVFIIVLSATLLIFDYEKVISNISEMDKVGVVLGVFVVSGGFGYIFSNLYFFSYWVFKKSLVANHVDVIKALSSKIIVKDKNGNDFANNLNRENCWVIMNAYWHSRINTSPRLSGVNIKNDQMSDITHGIGTSFVAAFMAIIVCLILYFSQPVEITCAKKLCILVLWFFFIIPPLFQYIRTINQSQSFVNSAFANEVNWEFEEINKDKQAKEPILLIFSE